MDYVWLLRNNVSKFWEKERSYVTMLPLVSPVVGRRAAQPQGSIGTYGAEMSPAFFPFSACIYCFKNGKKVRVPSGQLVS